MAPGFPAGPRRNRNRRALPRATLVAPVSALDAEELALAREIYAAFAATGAPPAATPDERLHALAARHVVVLDGDGRIVMAHPFAAHQEGTRVRSGAHEWWGNCAWDAFGIVAALGLRQATVDDGPVHLDVRDGRAEGDALFHVAVPARAWWDDIGFT
jgi:Alkylmercury lyase